ncbi:S-adenosyl-L-methionine-dependent methyltransferase [Pleomassaria siparia CBS 279.74]|uniref:S-adenosyl-L-methionine-dependent methyltransferase n=1 Tax=Pleomassaria siparia CBS 279.74 TaxID=1314801 RepID=A0A6G1KCD9_9PLEO|nr:S-adenosyl-L-methionine-dependent methyltransferase [Pleomassaria siparia CBS 279.74]
MESSPEARFQTDNTMTQKKQPRQQLSKAMEHMRFAVTADPIAPISSTSTSSPPPPPPPPPSEKTGAEPDAYGIPSTFAPVRKPAARSHSPSNNQKRTDPFAFGSRFLEDGDDIFEFNAWDHVETDETYRQFSLEQYERQRQDPVSEFDRKRFNAEPEKWWNVFYKNNKTNFFKNRKWLSQEFPILDEITKEGSPAALVLEVGAGAGNSAFPILEKSKNKGLKIHACDFSKKAVELIRGHELYNPELIQADVWDVAASPDSENGGLPPGIKEGSVDVVLMIFIFSALNPKQWDQAVRNIWKVLKPGGQVLFRDYGRGDLAQVRFKKGRWMEDNFYVRGDGTRVYFFEQEELESIWGGKRPIPSECKGNRAEDGKEGPVPTFDIVHFGVDRRMLVNRQRRLKMYRCWMQAVFRKDADAAGSATEVATSTLRQDKTEAVEAAEEES